MSTALVCRTLMAAALATTAATPLAAQDTSRSSTQELAELRAQLAALAARIDQLEGELDQANAQIATQAQAATPPPAEADTKISWKGAPEIQGKGGWSFKPRGRLQIDAGSVGVPPSTGREGGFGNEIRRARLGVEGEIPGGFGYKAELDFAGNEVEVTDAIMTYTDGGLTLSIGQHNNFQGLEELTSSRFISLLERAAFTDAFNFERRVGVSAQYGTDSFLMQGGLFSDNLGDLSNKNWSGDARAVFMPKMGGTQLHFAGSVHYADYEEGATVRYRQRPAVHFTDERFINTGTMAALSETGIGLEAAAIAGRFHATGETYWQSVNRPGALSDPTFFGGYAEVGMFLTNDKRGYKKGIFDRVKPSSPVGKGGMGAFQVNLRYDHLDLSDAGILGGTQDGYLASLVWTPTDYTRFMVNYGRMEYQDAVHATTDGDTSYGVDAVGVRAQVDF